MCGLALLMLGFCGAGLAQVPRAASRSAARGVEGSISPLSLGEGPGVRANATTLAVLLANCPKGMTEADWLQLMAKPENATLFPLRVTQAMLDTLDGREMDLRYRYVLVGSIAPMVPAGAR